MGEATRWLRKTLHGRIMNMVLPCVLILAAMILFYYCHVTAQDENDRSSKHFLGLIVIQMLPLVFLELQITSCPDPEAMLALFGTKVLLLHGCFMFLRVCAWPLMEVGIGWSNLAGTVAVAGVLHWGFRFRWRFHSILEHKDVGCLVLLATVGSIVSETIDGSTKLPMLLEHIIFTASSYIEVLGFVPAVWLVHLTAKKSDDVTRTGGVDLQRQAVFFFECSWLVSTSSRTLSRRGRSNTCQGSPQRAIPSTS
ncbi:unnamed protein product [Effrenium voratum]|uniref:Uncharacterized protein n=1 Tax=Effrenium voratum TaxID=2562239 RepID=A0AA36MKH1_9DINO|nr:unnamed protein product [Effrenium voratum]